MQNILKLISNTLGDVVITRKKFLYEFLSSNEKENFTVIAVVTKHQTKLKYYLTCIYNNVTQIYIEPITAEYYNELNPKWIYTVLHKDGKVIGIDIIR